MTCKHLIFSPRIDFTCDALKMLEMSFTRARKALRTTSTRPERSCRSAIEANVSAVQQKLKCHVRAILHLPVTKEDFDKPDLEKFGLGKKHTLEQWKEFFASILRQSSFLPTTPSLTTADISSKCRYRQMIHNDSAFVCGRALASLSDRQSITAVSVVDQQCCVLDYNNIIRRHKGTHPPFDTHTPFQSND